MFGVDELVGLLMLMIIIILGVMLYGCHAKAVSLKAKSNNQHHGGMRHRMLYEGLATAPAALPNGAVGTLSRNGVCNPNQIPITYLNSAPGGAPVTTCINNNTSPSGSCGPNQITRTYQNPQGAQVTVCVDASGGPDMSTCTAPWDMTATAEAQALAEVGGFQFDTYGERALQTAINAAYDSNVHYTNTDPQPSVPPGGDTDDGNPSN